LEPVEKDQVLDHARKRAPEIKQTFQERKDQIKKQKLEKLKETQNKRELKETKQRVMKVELVNEISELGGVWSVDEIDAKIKNKLVLEQFKCIILSIEISERSFT
jgi:hypothetical protein